ncbi:MAG: thioredoxin family protein [candidate division Zixibacteria bacterium]|nr:thioredoxin family protein [candidate division Zixibacteria bacterium]
MRRTAVAILGILVLALACAEKEAAERIYPKNYREILAASEVIEIHGETADSTKLEGDKYLVDNLDYILAQNKRVAVNFGAYWCKDCYKFDPYFREAAARPEYAGVVFAHAEVDGTRGNENFRNRFALPGVPVVMLFENGQPIEKNGQRGILFGEKGDKTRADLENLLKTFFGS